MAFSIKANLSRLERLHDRCRAAQQPHALRSRALQPCQRLCHVWHGRFCWLLLLLVRCVSCAEELHLSILDRCASILAAARVTCSVQSSQPPRSFLASDRDRDSDSTAAYCCRYVSAWMTCRACGAVVVRVVVVRRVASRQSTRFASLHARLVEANEEPKCNRYRVPHHTHRQAKGRAGVDDKGRQQLLTNIAGRSMNHDEF
jgi:hypothetical protein